MRSDARNEIAPTILNLQLSRVQSPVTASDQIGLIRNCSRVIDPGEVKPLCEYGIVSLSCKFERDAKHPDRIAYSKNGVTFKDGTTRPTFDLVLHPAK